MFGRDWQPARGRVVDQVVVSSNNNDGILVHYFIIDVQLPSGEQYRARVKEPRIATDFWNPRIGQVVQVQYEAKSRKVRFDKSDPGISYKAYRRARDEEFAERLEQPAGTGAPAASYLPVRSGAAVAPDQLQALLAAALSNAQVVRLDLADPNAQALRESIKARLAGNA